MDSRDICRVRAAGTSWSANAAFWGGEMRRNGSLSRLTDGTAGMTFRAVFEFAWVMRVRYVILVEVGREPGTDAPVQLRIFRAKVCTWNGAGLCLFAGRGLVSREPEIEPLSARVWDHPGRFAIPEGLVKSGCQSQALTSSYIAIYPPSTTITVPVT